MQNDGPEMTEISGPQAHVQAVIEGFKKRGHTVRLVATQAGRIQCSDDLCTWRNARLGITSSFVFRVVESLVRGLQSRLHLPFFRCFDSLRFADACINELREYDILYERYGLMNYGGILAGRYMRIPIALEVNGDVVYEYQQYGTKLSKVQWWIIHVITRRIFKASSHIIAVHNAFQERLLDYWQICSQKISVVTNGADYELFSLSRNGHQIRERYSLQAGSIIFYVGGFLPWHGTDSLIRAFELVRKQVPDAILVLVGDGPSRFLAEQIVYELGLGNYVQFMGFLPLEQVAELLSVAEVAVAPYQQSTGAVGLKVYEYMCAGKAIVTSSYNGNHTTIQDGVNGLLFEPGNVTQLSQAIERLLLDNSLRIKLGANAQRQALRKHTWDSTVWNIEQLLDRMLQTEIEQSW